MMSKSWSGRHLNNQNCLFRVPFRQVSPTSCQFDWFRISLSWHVVLCVHRNLSKTCHRERDGGRERVKEREREEREREREREWWVDIGPLVVIHTLVTTDDIVLDRLCMSISQTVYVTSSSLDTLWTSLFSYYFFVFIIRDSSKARAKGNS